MQPKDFSSDLHEQLASQANTIRQLLRLIEAFGGSSSVAVELASLPVANEMNRRWWGGYKCGVPSGAAALLFIEIIVVALKL